ncbi:GNAT family N-acetyltransferase, partial [Streptomyces sparsus]
MEPVELPAAGLLLRPWDRTEDDRQAVLHGLADPEFRRWNTVNAPTADAAGAQDFLTSAVEGWASGDQLSWAVTDASAGGRVLGNVALGTVDLRMRRARVSYWLLPQARGRGA